MRGLLLSRTKARWKAPTMVLLAAAVALGACWAGESEFVDPNATETAIETAQPAKVAAPAAAQSESAAKAVQAEQVEKTEKAGKPERVEGVEKAEKTEKTEQIGKTEKTEKTAPAQNAAQAEKPEPTAETAKAEKPEPAVAPKAQDPETSAKPDEKGVVPEPTASKEGPERAQDTAAKEKPPEGLVSLDALLVNPPLPEEEKALHDLLCNAIKAPANTGVQVVLKGKNATDISVRVAAIQALERNLPLQISAHDTELRKHALDEAWAAFLPVFSISGQYNNTNTFERKEELTPFEKIQKRTRTKAMEAIQGGSAPNPRKPLVLRMEFLNTPAGPNEVVFVQPQDKNHYYLVDAASGTIVRFPSVPPPSSSPTSGEGVLIGADKEGIRKFFQQNNLKLGYVDPEGHAEELPLVWNYRVASKRNRDDPRGTFSLTIFQQLPWGPQLQVTTTPVYHNQAYDSYGSKFERPWFSTFTCTLFLPLPATKNWGPYAPADASIKLLRQDREIALWNFKAQINAILRQVDALYLNLVNSVMNVDAAIRNRKTVETLAAQIAQSLAAGRTTQFGKDQVDAQVLSVKLAEEQAWAAYVAASDALVELTNMDPGTLLVPVAYLKGLGDRADYEPATAVATALENRAELKSAAASTKRKEIELRFARQQERPDLSATASASFSQTQVPNGEGFRGTGGIGYEHFDQSVGSVFNQDVLNESYSMTFRRALFQHAENARVEKARGYLEQQKLSARSTENLVENQVNDALARLDSAKASVEAAKTRLENARKAYDMTLDMQKEGRITEFEVISKSQELYDAERRQNAVFAEYKQAETELLYAQGTLASKYPERTAPNEFDRYRLGLLRASNALQFFGEGKEKKAP